MKQTKLILIATLGLVLGGAPAWGHEGGHGPKLTDTGSYGGLIAAVVDAKEHAKGTGAAVVFKAELVRGEDSTVRVYLYDGAMKPLSPNTLENTAKGLVIASKAGKLMESAFVLNLEGNHFVGKAPQSAVKPFNIEVSFKSKDQRDLIAAFEHLD